MSWAEFEKIKNLLYGKSGTSVIASPVRKIQRGTVLASGTGTQAVTLNGFTNLDKMMVIINGSTVFSYNTSPIGIADYVVESLSLTSLTISSPYIADNYTQATARNSKVSYQVIEYY